MDLSKDPFLGRCVGGFTQNNNKSLSQLIWKISPKIMSSEAITVELAVYTAAALFNEGSHSLHRPTFFRSWDQTILLRRFLAPESESDPRIAPLCSVFDKS